MNEHAPETIKLNQPIVRFKSFFQRKLERMRSFWHALIFPQRCYLSATILFLISKASESDTNTLLNIAMLFVIIGLLKEFIPKLYLFWESLIGKVFILFFYAIMANFALADAAGLVNDITGVEAEALTYTHNFALILSTPTWFLLTSYLALLAVNLVIPFYLLFLLFLKPFGIRIGWHRPDYKYVFSTALVRYLWTIALTFYVISYSVTWGLVNKDTPLIGRLYDEALGINVTKQPTKNIEPGLINENVVIAEEQAREDQSQDSITLRFGNEDISVEEVQQQGQAVASFKKVLIDKFIYEFEADPFSRCNVPEGTRVVELNTFEILVVRIKGETGEFEYEVQPCDSPGVNRLLNTNV